MYAIKKNPTTNPRAGQTPSPTNMCSPYPNDIANAVTAEFARLFVHASLRGTALRSVFEIIQKDVLPKSVVEAFLATRRPRS